MFKASAGVDSSAGLTFRHPGKSLGRLLSTNRGYERYSRENPMVPFPGTFLSAQCWPSEPTLQNQRAQVPWSRLDFSEE